MTTLLLVLYLVACGFYIWVTAEFSYLSITNDARSAYRDKTHHVNWSSVNSDDYREIMYAYELFMEARK